VAGENNVLSISRFTMNIFITGGVGFIGSTVTRLIIHNTSHRFQNWDKLTYAGNLNSLISINNVLSKNVTVREVFESIGSEGFTQVGVLRRGIIETIKLLNARIE
jgi:hypothetical protein